MICPYLLLRIYFNFSNVCVTQFLHVTYLQRCSHYTGTYMVQIYEAIPIDGSPSKHCVIRHINISLRTLATLMVTYYYDPWISFDIKQICLNKCVQVIGSAKIFLKCSTTCIRLLETVIGPDRYIRFIYATFICGQLRNVYRGITTTRNYWRQQP